MAAEQLGLEGMPRRLYSCTPSRLTTWLDCPRRYRMTYLDRPTPPKGPPWAHNSFGASVHNALARWWSLAARRSHARLGRSGCSTPAGSATATATTRSPTARCAAPGRWSRATSRRSTRTTSRWAANAPSAPVPRASPCPAGSTASTGGPADGSGDELVIVDYKTGRRPLSADDARSSMALAVYAVAAARTLRTRARRVELHHLPTGEVHVHEHTPESLARHMDRAASIALDASAADEAWRGGLSALQTSPEVAVARGRRAVPAEAVVAVRVVRLLPQLPGRARAAAPQQPGPPSTITERLWPSHDHCRRPYLIRTNAVRIPPVIAR